MLFLTFFFCIYYKVFLYKIINNIKYRVKKTLRHMLVLVWGSHMGQQAQDFF